MKTLFYSLLAASLCLSACTGRSTSTPADMLTLLVGTYTNGSSTGIYTFDFDQHTGQAAALDSATLPNPSFLTVSDDGRRVYAVNEMNDSTASLTTLDFDPARGSLKVIGRQPTHGTDPCYVSTDGTWVLTANYSGGSLSVFRLQADGIPLPPDTLFHGKATGPDPVRQILPHVHCAMFTPDGRYIYATDFSADRLMRFDVIDGGIRTSPDSTSVRLAPDTGPRHLVFTPDGRHAYVIGELSGDITAFRYAGGRLTVLQTVTADSVHARGSADIHVSPDGRFLYASNRGQHDGIAIFSIHPQDGTLTPAGYQPTGLHPRNFGISPNGKYLLAACRDSGVIQVYERNPETGLLTDTHRDIHVDKPVCVVYVNKP